MKNMHLDDYFDDFKSGKRGGKEENDDATTRLKGIFPKLRKLVASVLRLPVIWQFLVGAYRNVNCGGTSPPSI